MIQLQRNEKKINRVLMKQLMKATPSRGELLIPGDVDQVSLAGTGAVLDDIIDSVQIQKVRLIEIFRQGATFKIIVNTKSESQLAVLPRMLGSNSANCSITIC
jgi:ATP-dependent exoDNAse (exonuclease V) alpha subunit